MKILVINAGSSSLKFQLFDMENEKVIAKGNCEKIGLSGSFIGYKTKGDKVEKIVDMPNHDVATKYVFDILTDKEEGVIKSLDEISAIGHRFVQGGWIFDKSVLVDDKVIEELEKLTDLSPLHAFANMAGVKACMKVMPKTPQVIVFDTSFHATMPAKAYMYGIDYEDYQKYHIRKYGFHGTSHRYVLGKCAELLKKDKSAVNAITVHIGNGSSITLDQLEELWKQHDEANYNRYKELLENLNITVDVDTTTIEDLLKEINNKMDGINDNSAILDQILDLLQGIDWTKPDYSDKLDRIIEILENFKCNCDCGNSNEGILGNLEDVLS